MNRHYLLIAIAVILLTSCASVPGAREKINVNGMIYDTDNRPVVNYTVSLDDKYYAVTDIGGRFTINKVARDTYTFTGKGKGYLSMEQEVTVFDKTQIIYIKVPTIESKFNEAYVYMKEGKYSKAKLCIEEVLASDKDNSTALYFMSVIEYKEGNVEESDNYLNRIIENGDESNYVKELKKYIVTD